MVNADVSLANEVLEITAEFVVDMDTIVGTQLTGPVD